MYHVGMSNYGMTMLFYRLIYVTYTYIPRYLPIFDNFIMNDKISFKIVTNKNMLTSLFLNNNDKMSKTVLQRKKKVHVNINKKQLRHVLYS